MKLVIQGTLPGLNEIIQAAKTSAMTYRDMKETYTNLVAWEVIRQKIEPFERADFDIVWICPNQKHDKDNIQAGQKFIFDGLTESRRIKNDGWKQIGKVTHDFQVDKLNPRIEVEIIEKQF